MKKRLTFNIHRLDINENYISQLGISARLNQKLECILHQAYRYPTSELYEQLEKTVSSKLYNCKSQMVLACNGSDDAIFLTMQAFALPQAKKPLLLLQPTFSMYEHYANVLHLSVVRHPLESDFSVCFDDVERVILSQHPSMVFIPNPLAPTGAGLNTAVIQKLVKAYPSIYFVVDEAYIEFASIKSMIPLLPKHNNLLVLRTLSKFYGLAALRVGFLISQHRNSIKSLQAPYSLGVLNASLANHVIQTINQKKIQTLKSSIEHSRKQLIEAFRTSRFVEKISPSEANFIFLVSKNYIDFYEWLKSKGFLIKNLHHTYPYSLRITIPSPQQTKELVYLITAFDQLKRHK